MEAKLFSPLKIKSVEFKNRIGVSPMCMYSSTDGFVNDWHLVHLGSRAVGGAGLIIMEATAVSPEGRISPGDVGIWDDTHVEGLKRITDFIGSQGAVAGIQLAHAGRKASHQAPFEGGQALSADNGGWQTVAPSPLAFKESDPEPSELDDKGIVKVLNDFKLGARRALGAGFKVIEIHAAHGYLIHEFLSPLSNKRGDGFGGPFENRIKFLMMVIDKVKEEWPNDLPLFVRISATDWVEGGWSLDDSVRLAEQLKTKGVDLIDCSSGGNAITKIPVGPGYQTSFSAKIKEETGMLTAAVGLITEVSQAEQILAKDHADLILMARESLRNPYFPLNAAKELNVDVTWPAQYDRAK